MKSKQTKQKKAKTPKLVVTPLVTGNPNKVPFWRDIARLFLDGESDEWRIGEAALAMQFFGGLLCRNFAKLGAAAQATHANVVKVGFNLKFDRTATPPMVIMKLTGPVQKVADSAESEVPDDTQTDLPGYETEPDQAAGEASGSEGDLPPPEDAE